MQPSCEKMKNGFHGGPRKPFRNDYSEINRLAACSRIGDVLPDDPDAWLGHGSDGWSFLSTAIADGATTTWSSEVSTEDAIATWWIVIRTFTRGIWIGRRTTSHISWQASFDFWSLLRSGFQSSSDESRSIFFGELGSTESSLDNCTGILRSLSNFSTDDVGSFVWILSSGSGCGLSLLLQCWFGGFRSAENGDGDECSSDFGN